MLDPRALFAEHSKPQPGVDDAAFTVDALIVHDVKLRLSKRGSHLVLHDLCLHVVTDHLSGRILDRLTPADIDPYTRVKLQCLAARGRFRTTEHHTHLFAQLVREDTGGLCLVQNRCQLPQCLAHQPRLHAHCGHAHVALQLGLGHERRHGVYHDHIN